MEITLFKQALVFNPFDDVRKALDQNATATDGSSLFSVK